MFNIRLRPADVLFSRYIRLKTGYCEVCGRKGGGDEGISGLQVSHFWGRRNESVRFSEANADICCFSCHRKFHESPANYYIWKKKKLGEKIYKALEIEKNTFRKKDDKMILIYYREKMKELT